MPFLRGLGKENVRTKHELMKQISEDIRCKRPVLVSVDILFRLSFGIQKNTSCS